MNALKNLIKAVFGIGLTVAPFVANAQILSIGVEFEKLSLPEQFYRSLENCTAYTYTKPATTNNVSVSTTYNIEPTADGKCRLSVDGLTNVSVHITQNCDLTPEQAKTYAGALRRYQAKDYSPRWDGDRIEADEDYKTAYAIMSDRKICRFIRDKIDHTQKIRAALSSCASAKETETTAAVIAEREIIGKSEDICHYRFSLQNRKAANDAKGEDDKQLVFDCHLNKEQTARYLQILETMVVPEEEGYDFAALQRISPAEEMNFILDNCTFDAK